MEAPFGTAVLIAAAAFCLITTFAAAIAPAAFAKRLGLIIANPGGSNEVRAQYAGFFFAVAIACLAGLAGILPRSACFVVLLVVFGGLFAGRVASLGLDRGIMGYTQTILALHAIDAVGCTLAIVALLVDHTG